MTAACLHVVADVSYSPRLAQTLKTKEFCGLSMNAPVPSLTLRVLTVNTHKGFAFLSRRFVLSELREAVRAVGADLVFLQEVQGSHAGNSASVAGWPEAPHYEFLAEALWPEFAYGRNAVYPHGHHGNAVLSKFPIVAYENRDVSIDGHETRGLLHCMLRLPGHPLDLHAICVHLGLKESHRRQQLALLAEVIRDQVPADGAADRRRRLQRLGGPGARILEESAGLREVFVHSNGRSAKNLPGELSAAAARPHLRAQRARPRAAAAAAPAVVAPVRPRAAGGGDRPVSTRWRSGNRVRLLENGEEFFPAVFEAIARRGTRSSSRPSSCSRTRSAWSCTRR